MDPKQPLWMPQGSVRAILAIVLVGAFIALAFLGRSLEAMTGIVGAVVGWYFAKTDPNV